MTKALALFSGGLDSSLAVCLMKDQHMEVHAVHFFSVFTTKGVTSRESPIVRAAAEEMHVPLLTEDNSEEFLALIKNPKHGYGRNMNPCIDCRIRNLNRAAVLMREIGAEFLVTGEVVGQRPMSQNRGSLRQIEKLTGLGGLILRPLSAKLLDPTLPEQKGRIDRERLPGISGRSRKPQFALAKQYGLRHFSSPAGGCLVTDPGFSERLRELLAHNPDCDINDVNLLKVGRHFRLSPAVKAVVGRNQQENDLLTALSRPGDALLHVTICPGPLTLVRGASDRDTLAASAALTVRHGKASAMRQAPVKVEIVGTADGPDRIVEAAPADEGLLDRTRIAYDKTMVTKRPAAE